MKKYLYILAAMFIGATVLTGCSDDDNATPAPSPTPAPETDVVDLGLPSGTLWATANLGAESSTEAGNLYAWGETYTKTNFSQSNYFDPSSTIVTSNITGTSYDAAKVALGGDWIMPTQEQFQELFEQCEVTNVTEKRTVDNKEVDVVVGIKLVGPNEKILYLPAVTSSVAGEGDLYDSYFDEKGKQSYVKFESVFATYWTGDIASSDPQNANQYAVQTVYVEHGKDAIKKGGKDQYEAVAYNRSRLAGAPIRPVKAYGGTPVADYVDITGAWAQSDASGNIKDFSEAPKFLSFEGTNYNGSGVVVNYGAAIDEMTYSRDINEITIVDEDGDKETVTVADVTTIGDGIRVISLSAEGKTLYFTQTEEEAAIRVPVEDLAGKWNFTFNGEEYAINVIDDENIIVKNPEGENVSSTFKYRFGTFDIDANGFDGTFAVQPIVGGDCPFQFVGEGQTISFTVRPPVYELLYSWDGMTALPSWITLGSSVSTSAGNKQNANGTTYATMIVFGSTLNSVDATKAAKIQIDGGFKVGDRLRFKGYANHATTVSTVRLFDKNEKLGEASPVFPQNSVTQLDTYSEFVITSDIPGEIYIGRSGGTSTRVCEIIIERDKF